MSIENLYLNRYKVSKNTYFSDIYNQVFNMEYDPHNYICRRRLQSVIYLLQKLNVLPKEYEFSTYKNGVGSLDLSSDLVIGYNRVPVIFTSEQLNSLHELNDYIKHIGIKGFELATDLLSIKTSLLSEEGKEVTLDELEDAYRTKIERKLYLDDTRENMGVVFSSIIEYISSHTI